MCLLHKSSHQLVNKGKIHSLRTGQNDGKVMFWPFKGQKSGIKRAFISISVRRIGRKTSDCCYSYQLSTDKGATNAWQSRKHPTGEGIRAKRRADSEGLTSSPISRSIYYQ